MNQNSIRNILLPIILVLVFSQCTPPQGDFKIPFDAVKASRHVISMEEAESLKNGFQDAKKELYARIPGKYLDSAFNLPDAELFNRDALAALLNAKGAKNLRIYLGRDEKGQVRFVLLPVDSAGVDIQVTLIPGNRAVSVPGISSATAQGGAQAMESGQRCPPLCKTVETK
ncbi:hypothetical protein SAMN05518672_114125 [Chitinophaga sp. CF118]|uniref:hypothetical protein n=1 Tax=Chitinophaga sp. CF118 TaxID=1884367 RepID=UPI0008EAFC37|nr:hypothetical protein [Chitinophaga sp. CF118]SFF03071.1 hypothetical protein SAMN05518672_114125 [Chitinophaga sp. CF118]